MGGIHDQHVALQCRRDAGALRAGAAAMVPAAESAGACGRAAGTGFQHRGQFHDQYQLAGLRRRKHDELSDPDGRAGVPQLRFGCSGNRGGNRDRAGLRAPHGQNDRQLLVRSDSRHAVGSDADLPCVGPGSGMAGSAAELQRLYAGEDCRGRRPANRPGTGRFAGDHKGDSAPTAEDSSTPTRPIRTRIRPRLRI